MKQTNLLAIVVLEIKRWRRAGTLMTLGASLAIATGCTDCDLEPDFTASSTTVAVGEVVTFRSSQELSNIGLASDWDFEGGTLNSEPSEEVANVIYTSPGTYDVSLTLRSVDANCKSETVNKDNFITVVAATSNGCDGITSVTDADGNTYDVVEIAGQCWMAENLKTSVYNDGASIPNNLDDVTWAGTTEGAFAIFNEDISNDNTYGKLYNFFAVASGKLCPPGWHTASQVEWQMLVNEVSADASALKATTNWVVAGATNSSGFSALPGSLRAYYGTFGFTSANLGEYAGFWTSTEAAGSEGDEYGMMWYMSANDSFVQNTELYKNSGLSCRCVRD